MSTTPCITMSLMCWLLFLGDGVSFDSVLQPCGPRLCEMLCRHISDCSTPLFHKELLTCYLTNSTRRSPKLSRLERCKHHNASPCDDYSRLLVTRLQRTKCVISRTKSKRDTVLKETKFGSSSGKKHRVKKLSLHEACEKGKLQRVKYILSRSPALINSRGKLKRTPVMAAAIGGTVGVFEYLLFHNCDITARDQNNNTVLHLACLGGSLTIVRRLIVGFKLDIDLRGQQGGTPVMFAALGGHKEIFRWLVNKGCNVTAVNNINNNILHTACTRGHLNIVEYIVRRKLVNIDKRGFDGDTAVMLAVLIGHRNIVEFLISRGCNVRLLDCLMNNLLHLSCFQKNLDLVKYLISQNFSKESREQMGRTPLLIAASAGNKAVFNLLEREGCDVKAVDNYRNNILHIACRSGKVNMVRYIITQNKTDIESRGWHGRTALLTAAETGQLEVLKLLVSMGCNETAKNDDNNTMLHLACVRGHLDIVKYIISHNMIGKEKRGYAGRTPLLVSAETRYMEVFNFLLEEGCDAEAVDEHNNTILHIACLGGYVHMVNFIIKLNKIPIDSGGQKRRTPLLNAAGMGHVNVVDFLVIKGANTMAVDEDKNNILYLACLGGNVEMVRYVVTEIKFDIEARGCQGETPVLCAAAQGHEDVVQFLMENGCNMKAVDHNDNSVLHAACAYGHLEMVRYLLKLRVIDQNEKNSFGLTPLGVAKTYGYTEIVDLLKTQK